MSKIVVDPLKIKEDNLRKDDNLRKELEIQKEKQARLEEESRRLDTIIEEERRKKEKQKEEAHRLQKEEKGANDCLRKAFDEFHKRSLRKMTREFQKEMAKKKTKNQNQNKEETSDEEDDSEVEQDQNKEETTDKEDGSNSETAEDTEQEEENNEQEQKKEASKAQKEKTSIFYFGDLFQQRKAKNDLQTQEAKVGFYELDGHRVSLTNDQWIQIFIIKLLMCGIPLLAKFPPYHMRLFALANKDISLSSHNHH